jgi:hypothetical protein
MEWINQEGAGKIFLVSKHWSWTHIAMG